MYDSYCKKKLARQVFVSHLGATDLIIFKVILKKFLLNIMFVGETIKKDKLITCF